jgi:hypothetical protein
MGLVSNLRKILRRFQGGSSWMDGQPAASPAKGAGFAAGFTL